MQNSPSQAPDVRFLNRWPFLHVSDWDSAVSLQRGPVRAYTSSGLQLILSLCSKGLLIESSGFSGPLTFVGPENEIECTSHSREKRAGLTQGEREMLYWMLNANL